MTPYGWRLLGYTLVLILEAAFVVWLVTDYATRGWSP